MDNQINTMDKGSSLFALYCYFYQQESQMMSRRIKAAKAAKRMKKESEMPNQSL